MKKTILLLITILSLSATAKSVETVSSPDGKLTLSAGVRQGQAYYQLSRGSEPVINPSNLGFQLSQGLLSGNFRIVGFQRDTKNETWEQPWGEERFVRNHYNELRMRLQEKKGLKRLLNVVFRVFDDGIGFRYEFPLQPHLKQFEIMDELTEFNLPWDAQMWSQPTNGTVYYEALYTKTPVSRKDTVSTPVTIEAKPNLYLAIHEANLTDYASLNLTPRGTKLLTALTPWQSGVKVYAQAPFVSPWRTIIVGSKPGDLIASRLILNLNEPCRIDTSWLDTGRYIGIWWGMHMNDYTWAQGPKHGATTEMTRRYIDFAAQHGFRGVLVEGWNEGWDGDWTRIGNHFKFTKPYPDYDLEGLCRYAASKGVRLIAHNETGGSATNYEQQLDAAFALYQRLGINSVKTGYVNMMLDGKETQHSQYGIRHYRKVVETAAKYHLMIVNHEGAMPTGLRRTYPNLVATEDMRGQEYNAWSQDGGNPPYHEVLLPFTRGLAGPMDYTPGIFNFTNKAVPATHPQSTLAKQLSLYVLLYTPWQMAADEIENYEYQPALSFIESCPTNWAVSKVIDAQIGRYLVMARKDRDSDRWFVGGATDSEARTLTIPLDFLDTNTVYRAVIYQDGPGADYRTNPYPMTILQQDVSSTGSLHINLAPSGGFAIRIEKKD
ncbi:glycoside hydrolase family 97 protein [Prevotella sp. khp7]|uniref:glycoside hydrolase family 97 protein n=1 Tax=Prevotella sp. khp7 TaxID=1761885 RepID=UPI0029372C51|nr:glycoside hydrolase family 97 protein [Prevotella sp. khp7]